MISHALRVDVHGIRREFARSDAGTSTVSPWLRAWIRYRHSILDGTDSPMGGADLSSVILTAFLLLVLPVVFAYLLSVAGCLALGVKALFRRLREHGFLRKRKWPADPSISNRDVAGSATAREPGVRTSRARKKERGAERSPF